MASICSFTLFARRKPDVNQDWQRKLPDFIKRLEEALYRLADSRVRLRFCSLYWTSALMPLPDTGRHQFVNRKCEKFAPARRMLCTGRVRHVRLTQRLTHDLFVSSACSMVASARCQIAVMINCQSRARPLQRVRIMQGCPGPLRRAQVSRCDWCESAAGGVCRPLDTGAQAAGSGAKDGEQAGAD